MSLVFFKHLILQNDHYNRDMVSANFSPNSFVKRYFCSKGDNEAILLLSSHSNVSTLSVLFRENNPLCAAHASRMKRSYSYAFVKAKYLRLIT